MFSVLIRVFTFCSNFLACRSVGFRSFGCCLIEGLWVHFVMGYHALFFELWNIVRLMQGHLIAGYYCFMVLAFSPLGQAVDKSKIDGGADSRCCDGGNNNKKVGVLKEKHLDKVVPGPDKSWYTTETFIRGAVSLPTEEEPHYYKKKMYMIFLPFKPYILSISCAYTFSTNYPKIVSDQSKKPPIWWPSYCHVMWWLYHQTEIFPPPSMYAFLDHPNVIL